MMSSKLRRIFNPTIEEQIQDYEFLLKLHTEQLGQCSTCANLIYGDMSGVVTDYGMCRKNKKTGEGQHEKRILCGMYLSPIFERL